MGVVPHETHLVARNQPLLIDHVNGVGECPRNDTVLAFHQLVTVKGFVDGQVADGQLLQLRAQGGGVGGGGCGGFGGGGGGGGGSRHDARVGVNARVWFGVRVQVLVEGGSESEVAHSECEEQKRSSQDLSRKCFSAAWKQCSAV